MCQLWAVGGLIWRLRILPVGPFGELVGEPQDPGVLVRGDPFLDVGLELAGAGGRAGFEDDGRADLLTELVVGYADDRGLEDVGVGVEDFLVKHQVTTPNEYSAPTGSVLGLFRWPWGRGKQHKSTGSLPCP